MKQYDFETVTPRYEIGAPKWLAIKKYFPEEPEGIIPFSVADMELPMAPEIVEGLQKFVGKYALGYGKATKEYVDAVCKWMKERHNWEIKPEWLVYTRGVVNAFYESVRAFTDPGDGVIMCTPIYYPMYDSILKNGRKLAECQMLNKKTHYELDFELLEELAKKPENKLLIFCNPHNPGGRVWTREELQKVADICIANDVIIASDEIHFDLLAPGVEHTVFANLSPEVAQHCVIMTAPSKTFNLAGLETSNIIIPNEDLRKRYVTQIEQGFMDPRCCLLGFEACRIAYTECGEWLDQLNDLIAGNAKLVEDFLKKEFPETCCMKMEGTYLLWMDFSALGIESKKMGEVLRKDGKLFFDDGYIFGPDGEGYERWNLACPRKYVEEALPRLKEVLNRYRTK